jgi:hypothetical protein
MIYTLLKFISPGKSGTKEGPFIAIRNNLSQLVPPMGGNNGGNAGDMKKSTSKLNLKQILVTDQRS